MNVVIINSEDYRRAKITLDAIESEKNRDSNFTDKRSIERFALDQLVQSIQKEVRRYENLIALRSNP